MNRRSTVTIRCMSAKLSIGLAVNRDDDVADLEAGRRGDTVGHDAVDARNRARLAEIKRHARKDQSGEDEVRNRTGGHDRGARPDPLVVEADPARSSAVMQASVSVERASRLPFRRRRI